MSGISVYPPVVEFHSIEKGTLFVATISIQNTAPIAQRIRILPPKSNDFTINYTPAGPVAPGLEVLAEVEFLTDSSGLDYHDNLTIACGGNSMKVPLHAYAPRSDVVADSLVDFGTVVLNNTASHMLQVSNLGTGPGTFNIVLEEAIPISASPMSGTLECMKPSSTELAKAIMGTTSSENKSTASISIGFVAREVGSFHTVAKLCADGQPARVINIHATVVDQKLELRLPDEGNSTNQSDQFDFGTIYFGQRRVLQVAIVNHGPENCSYQVNLDPGTGFDAYRVTAKQDFMDGGDDDSNDHNENRDDDDEALAATNRTPGLDSQAFGDQPPLNVSPIEGILDGYQEQVLEIVFYPRVINLKRGFRLDAVQQAKRIDFVMEMEVVCLETGQSLPLHVEGMAVQHQLVTSQKSFKFGACATNDRRDILLTLTNECQELPVKFAINRLVFFQVKPAQGRLLPKQTTTVVVSFTPGHMGSFRNTLHLILDEGIKVIPLRVMGSSASLGQRKRLPGGPDALPSDFDPKHKYVKPRVRLVSDNSDTDGEMRLSGTIGDTSLPGTQEEKVGEPLRNGSIGNPGDMIVFHSDEERKEFVRKQAWEKLEERNRERQGAAGPEQDADLFQVTSDALYTYSVDDLRRRQLHRDQYTMYLKRAHTARDGQRIARKTLARGALNPGSENSVDIGIDPCGGLEPPSLKVARKVPGNGEHQLWLERPLPEDAGASSPTSHVRRRPKVFNENKMIKRKFKPQPTTQVEVRDCVAKLSMDQLDQVTAGPKIINFGTVCVNSLTTKTLTVCNDNASSVLVEILTHEHQELASSSPLSQVIPSGSTAGFDISFMCQSQEETSVTNGQANSRIFRKSVDYIVNGQHKFRFAVCVEVVPIKLELSVLSLSIRFPDDNMDSRITEHITVTNTGNAIAHYNWATSSQDSAEAASNSDEIVAAQSRAANSAFTCKPAVGVIEPFSTITTAVTFRPNHEYPKEDNLVLRVKGGNSLSLACLGQIDEPRCVFLDKKVDFDTLAVGITQERQITLKNVGNHPAVFWVDPKSLVVNSSSVVKKRGKVLKGEAKEKDENCERDSTSSTNETVLEIVPSKGRVPTGETLELSLSINPLSAQIFQNTTINVHFRGGKTQRLPIHGQALVPDLIIPQDIFEFGGVTVGCHSSQTISLINKSEIPAVTFFDLSQHPDFSISLLRDTGINNKQQDDAVSAMVPVGGSKGGISGNSSAAAVIAAANKRAGVSGASLSNNEGGDGATDVEDTDDCKEFRITVGAHKTLLLSLVFEPSQEINYAFELPMTLVGASAAKAKMFRKLVTGVGLKPRVHVSSSKLDFGAQVIKRDAVKKVPYYHEITLRNGDGGPVTWVVNPTALKNGPSGGVFGVDPARGTLENDGDVAVLRVSFLPEENQLVQDMLPIYVYDAELTKNTADKFAAPVGNAAPKGKPYLFVEITGQGTFPKLTFDRPLVELPVVPLGVRSRVTFWVNNHGYENLELSAKLPPDSHRIPLSISFPEGKNLSMAKERVPVQVTFVSRRAMSFTAKIHMFDSENKRFSIPITGTADNSIITNFDFVRAVKSKVRFFQAPSGDKAIQLQTYVGPVRRRPSVNSSGKFQPLAKSPTSKSEIQAAAGENSTDVLLISDIPASPRKLNSRHTSSADSSRSKVSAAGSTTSGKTANASESGASVGHGGASHSFGIVAVADELEMDKVNPMDIAVLQRWINATLLKSPVAKFPRDFVQSHGRQVIEIIEGLSGRTINGKITRLPPNKRDQATQLYRQYSSMLAYLKGQGALLHNVRPEFLLNLDGFTRISLANLALAEQEIEGEESIALRSSREVVDKNGDGGGAKSKSNTSGNAKTQSDKKLEQAVASASGYFSPAQRLQISKELETKYKSTSERAWLTLIYQIIKVLVLGRVTPKHIRSLPGMELVFGSVHNVNAGPMEEATDSSSVDKGGANARARQAKAQSAADNGNNNKRVRRGMRNGGGASGANGSGSSGTGSGVNAQKAFMNNLQGSNVYSVAELLLLKWISFHAQRGRDIVSKYMQLTPGVPLVPISGTPNPASANAPAGGSNVGTKGANAGKGATVAVANGAVTDRTSGEEGVRQLVVDLGEDLSDGTALAFLIVSHVPLICGKNKPLQDVAIEPSDDAQAEYNLEKVLIALDSLGLGYHFDVKDMLQKQYSARDNLLFVLYLYQNLPQYIPKATIEFTTPLGGIVTKGLELKNPSRDKLVNYKVHLEGSNDFSVGADVVRLDPKATEVLQLQYTSHFSKRSTARLTLKPERSGGASASTLVFKLVSCVNARNAVQTMRCQTNQYEPLEFEMEVVNPFTKNCHFKILLSQEMTKSNMPQLASIKKKKRGHNTGSAGGAKTSINTKGDSDTNNRLVVYQNQRNLPDAFHCATKSMALKANDSGTLILQFVPFLMGEFRCQVVFLDENAGEFLYEVVGVCLPPANMDRVEMRLEMRPAVNKVLGVPARNVLFDKAMSVVKERNRGGRMPAAVSAPIGGADGAGAGAVGESPGKGVDTTESPTDINLNLKLGRRNSKMPAKELQPRETFVVEFTSPFFTSLKDAAILTTASGGRAGNSGISPTVEMGFGSVPVTKLKLLTPPSTASSRHAQTAEQESAENRIPFGFQPKAPGVYETQVLMFCSRTGEFRMYEMEVIVSTPPIISEMEFACPARQVITQGIPIQNNTADTWTLQATFRGDLDGFGGPRTLVVPNSNGGQSSIYNLLFKPEWVGAYKAELELSNTTTNEAIKYTLNGVAEEPLAEDHVTIDCRARDKIVHKFTVRNISQKSVDYHVESDIPHVSGDSSIWVSASSAGDYELTVNPLMGGTYSGSITFSQGPGLPYVWYTVELNVLSPKPEEALELSTEVRKAVSLEVTLANPLDIPVEFEVMLNGHGLLGDNTFNMVPKETASYELIYSPLLPGKQVGSISFVSEQVGEIWYQLNLESTPTDPVKLEIMKCAVGSKTSHQVELENPTGERLELRALINNRRNFSVSPATVMLKPYTSTFVNIEYTPSSLGQVETSSVELSHPHVGSWVFVCSGQGSQPSTMAPVVVIANCGTQVSSTFTFRNPFTEAIRVGISLSSPTDDLVNDPRGSPREASSVAGGIGAATALASTGGAAGAGANAKPRIFNLLLKRPTHVVPAFGSMQVPFAFSPQEMSEQNAFVTVLAQDMDLSWTFPLKGVTEALPTDKVLLFQCKARGVYSQIVEVPLTGLDDIVEDETFIHEIEIKDPTKEELVTRSFTIKPADNRLKTSPAQFIVDFVPLRPFEAHLDLIIKRRNGGRWRFQVRLEALPPDPDDTLVIHADINSTSTVSFKLPNRYSTYTPFKALFTPDSSYEFTVFPPAGELEPAESPEGGTMFQVSFTPTEYGKKFTGTLVIETEEMQWTYAVRGSNPDYHAPNPEPKVSSHASPAMMSALNRAHRGKGSPKGQGASPKGQGSSLRGNGSPKGSF